MSEKRIIEINGIKMEVDLRTAKRVDEFKVGNSVKVLIKDYSGYKSYLGMIVGFDEFKSLPTIIVAYVDASSWAEAPLKFVYINSKTADTEICAQDPDDLGIDRTDIITQFDRAMAKKEQELIELQQKRNYFDRMFGKIFEPVENKNAS